MEVTTIVTIEMTQIQEIPNADHVDHQTAKQRYCEQIRDIIMDRFSNIDDLNIKVQVFINEDTK